MPTPPLRDPLRLLVLQHHPAEGPGRLHAWAAARGHRLELRPAWVGLQGSLPPASALLLLGGPAHLDAAPAWLQAELALLRPWVAAGRPLFGICLGAQILAHLLGGRVTAMPAPETGWQTLQFDDGRRLDALQWHEQAISLPPAFSSRAHSAACAVQVFGAGAQRGLQFHPEWDAQSLAALHQGFGADCPLPHQPEPARDAAVAAWFFAELDDWVRHIPRP